MKGFDNIHRASGQSICSSDCCFMFEPCTLVHNCFLQSSMIDEGPRSFPFCICECASRGTSQVRDVAKWRNCYKNTPLVSLIPHVRGGWFPHFQGLCQIRAWECCSSNCSNFLAELTISENWNKYRTCGQLCLSKLETPQGVMFVLDQTFAVHN